MFGDYKEAIKILERQQTLHRMREKRAAWWDVSGRAHHRSCQLALELAINALESAWNEEEREFARKYLQHDLPLEDLPYDAVQVYKRELAAKGGKCDA